MKKIPFYKFKEKFNRFFDFVSSRTITIPLTNSKYIIFTDTGKQSGNRSKQIFDKEKSTIQWINSFEKGSKFLDIGANIGTFTLYAAIFNSCKVYSLEPSSSSNAILNNNIFLNNLSNQIVAFPYVASYKNSPDYFYKTRVSLDATGGFPYKKIDARGQDFTSRHIEGAACIKVDTLLDKIGQIDYIKIDVDGNEWELILGMRKSIRKKVFKSLMIELNEKSENYKKIISFLEKNNYKINRELTTIADISKKNNTKIFNHYFYID